MVKAFLFVLIMAAVILFFWHAEVANWLSIGQQQVEEQAPGLIQKGMETSQNWWAENAKEKADEIVASLTAAGKEKIDQWLEDSNLNQYGDPAGTMYTGGTPLFNEATGASIDRYSYILLQHPNLVEDLGLGNYFK